MTYTRPFINHELQNTHASNSECHQTSPKSSPAASMIPPPLSSPLPPPSSTPHLGISTALGYETERNLYVALLFQVLEIPATCMGDCFAKFIGLYLSSLQMFDVCEALLFGCIEFCWRRLGIQESLNMCLVIFLFFSIQRHLVFLMQVMYFRKIIDIIILKKGNGVCMTGQI